MLGDDFKDDPEDSRNNDNRLVRSRVHDIVPDTVMGHLDDTPKSRDVDSQVLASLRSIKQRLENLEDQSSDPFGDLKNALKSIEALSQNLVDDLGKRYQTNIDQMSQAAISLGMWHSQLKSVVNKYCDERNDKLHKAGEQIFTRLLALEQAGAGSTLHEHKQRLEILETSAKSCVNKKLFDDSVAKLSQVEQNFRKLRRHEDARWEQYKQRIDAVRKTVQDFSSSTDDRLETSEAECSKRHDDLRNASDKTDVRLTKLEQHSNQLALTKGARSTADQPEKVERILDGHSSRIDRLHADVEALRSTVSQLAARESKHEEQSRARDGSQRDAIKRIETGLTALQKRFDAFDKATNTTQASATNNTEVEAKICALSRRLDDCEKSSPGMSSDSPVSLVSGGGDSKEHARTAASTGPAQHRYRTPTKYGEPQSTAERLDQLQSASRAVLQHSRTVAERQAMTTATPSARINALEQFSAPPDFIEKCGALVQRVADIELTSSPAHLESRFRSLSEEVASIEKAIDDKLSAYGLNALSEKVRELDSRSTDQLPDVASLQDLQQRLDNVEEHARTSATKHNATRSTHDSLQTRLRALETLAKQKSVDAVTEKLSRRLATLEYHTSDTSIQQRIDAIFAPSIATLTDLVGRTAVLEDGSKKASASLQQLLQPTWARISALEKSSVDVAVDRRFESFSETLVQVQEATAAVPSKAQIDAESIRIDKVEETLDQGSCTELDHERQEVVLARLNSLESDVQDVNVARGVRGQVIDDLIKRTDTVDVHLNEKQAAINILHEKTASLSDRHDDLSDRIVDLSEVVEDTRGWIGRVGEKSQKDGQVILGRIQLVDHEHILRVKHAEDGVERLQNDIQNLRSFELITRARRQAALTDEIRRLRERMRDELLDDGARRQLLELTQLITEGRLLRSSRPEPTPEESNGVLYNALHPRPSASGKIVPPAIETNGATDTDKMSNSSINEAPQREQDNKGTGQILEKRRRTSEWDDSGKSTTAGAEGTETDEDDAEDDETYQPRRSGRMGKGKNRRL